MYVMHGNSLPQFSFFSLEQLPHRRGAIPEAGIILNNLLELVFHDDNLLKLEFLTDFYQEYGLFRFDDKIYMFDQKLTQTVINKLEKGAHDYLENSPLKNTILGSTNRSPEVRRAIATIFRKSVLEEKGNLIIQDVEKFCDKMSEEAKEGKSLETRVFCACIFDDPFLYKVF